MSIVGLFTSGWLVRDSVGEFTRPPRTRGGRLVYSPGGKAGLAPTAPNPRRIRGFRAAADRGRALGSETESRGSSGTVTVPLGPPSATPLGLSRSLVDTSREVNSRVPLGGPQASPRA